MTSKEANISKPGKLDIDLRDDDKLQLSYNTVTLQNFNTYKNMVSHDPYTCYIIQGEDGDLERLFIGDLEINRSAHGVKYLISYDTKRDEYVLYQNFRTNWHDYLVEVARYATGEEALNALNDHDHIGSDEKRKRAIYLALNAYIKGLAILHHTLIQFICIGGFQDDPRVQELNMFANAYGVNQYQKDLPQTLRAVLHNLARERPDSLIPLYSQLYDAMVIHDCFRHDRCEGERIDYAMYEDTIGNIARILP